MYRLFLLSTHICTKYKFVLESSILEQLPRIKYHQSKDSRLATVYFNYNFKVYQSLNFSDSFTKNDQRYTLGTYSVLHTLSKSCNSINHVVKYKLLVPHTYQSRRSTKLGHNYVGIDQLLPKQKLYFRVYQLRCLYLRVSVPIALSTFYDQYTNCA